jgi:polyhydroxybutyrate depolymerase
MASRPLTALTALIPWAALTAVALGAATVQEVTVATPDGPRHYRLALPTGVSPKGRPLVLVFHGHLGSAANVLGGGFLDRSPLRAWSTVADREGLVVAALDGAKGADGKSGWNDGRPGGAGNPATDDVAFTQAVLERIERELGTDPGRVYAMGMSNGGVFVFRLALASRHPLAAVAAACASMPGDHPPPRADRPVSLLMIEGADDPLMPYAGGQVHFKEQRRGAVLGTETSLAFWRTSDGLEGEPRVEALPHIPRRADPTRVTRYVWGPEDGPQVMLLKVEGGGHCEPSLEHRYGALYTALCGKQNGDLETVEEVWRFFKGKRVR